MHVRLRPDECCCRTGMRAPHALLIQGRRQWASAFLHLSFTSPLHCPPPCPTQFFLKHDETTGAKLREPRNADLAADKGIDVASLFMAWMADEMPGFDYPGKTKLVSWGARQPWPCGAQHHSSR